ncbi:MAG TPA: rod shape-determining protein MreD [Acidimicrobiia bacterium]|nr:rod shape-determining protein MreD [Acidimicrobiia bacterium]
MRVRTPAAVFLILLVAVVLQSTLFGRIRVITPDLVLLVAILIALTRIKPELVLAIAFSAGLVVDLLGSSLLGLRAIVFMSAAYIALRTRERADIGRIATALWAGGMTLIGVVLLVLLGTLFGQSTILGEHVLSRLVTVPLANMLLAFIIAPVLVRTVDQDPAALRY